MEEKYDEQYLELLNSIYFKLQSNDKLKEFVGNSELYNDFCNAINILYQDRANIYENAAIKYNIKHFVKSFAFIDEKTNHLSEIRTYNIQILKHMKQIIEYQKEAYSYSTEILDNKISKDEFSIRYDKLLDMLSNDDKNSNLTINTISENRPFKLIKNSNNQITAIIGNGSKISLTKEALMNRAYNGEEHSHPSYADTLIQTIFDNTVFNNIQNNPPFDFSHMPEEKIKKLEEERLKTSGQIKDLEEKLNKRDDEFNQLKMLLTKASTLEDDFNSAKESVLKFFTSDTSNTYWDKQSTKYSIRYWMYLILSILSIGMLAWWANDYIIEHKLFDSDTLFTPKHALLFFVSTIVIWFVKIFIKISLSNYHLAIDANERVIMVKTYLALIQNNEFHDENDKKLMIESIFRQTNHGIIKDETSVTVADIITSFKK